MEAQITPINETSYGTIEEVLLYLNTAHCQSPVDISKTRKAIDYIKYYNSFGRFQVSGSHHINIILTNCSLAEASQWTVRLNNNLKHLKTIILASKKGSDVKNLNELWGRLIRIRKPDELPDLIVMCTHEKRTSDLVNLIETLKIGRYNLTKLGIHHITVSIMFDEADKNIKLIVNCLKDIWPLLRNKDERKDDTIRDIQFITATPLDDFWKALKKAGISKLKNVNDAIKSMNENSVLHGPYNEIMKDYRALTDHKIDTSESSCTEHPVDYARLVLNKLGSHDSNNPRVIFAPADKHCESHCDMRDTFMSKGYWVYIDNSDTKRGRRFYSPCGKVITLDLFREKYNLTGETYDTFCKWRELYPTSSLVITGWYTIIRGVTFNTTGFNFTNMILSACHARNIADLIQAAGRGNGDKKYVSTFIIHSPQKVWDTIKERVDLMSELLNKNDLSEFEEHDFRPTTARDIMEKAMTVPLVIPITSDEWQHVQKTGRTYDKDKILGVIRKYNPTLASELSVMEKKQITQPESESSIKKHITDFLNAACENKKYKIDITKDEANRKVDLYQIFIDKTAGSPKLIVSIFKGGLLPQ